MCSSPTYRGALCVVVEHFVFFCYMRTSVHAQTLRFVTNNRWHAARLRSTAKHYTRRRHGERTRCRHHRNDILLDVRPQQLVLVKHRVEELGRAYELDLVEPVIPVFLGRVDEVVRNALMGIAASVRCRRPVPILQNQLQKRRHHGRAVADPSAALRCSLRTCPRFCSGFRIRDRFRLCFRQCFSNWRRRRCAYDRQSVGQVGLLGRHDGHGGLTDRIRNLIMNTAR